LVNESASPTTAADLLRSYVESNSHLYPGILEHGPVAWDVADAASCFNTRPPASRSEEFRPLFLFVARSARFGEAAREVVDSRVEVPSGDLR
jgi:hypothetical protein